MSSMVIGHGFPQLETSKYTFQVSSEWFVSCSLKVFLDATDAEINETISKCGINQEIIQKSCGDGKIESSTLYLLMGIFRLWSSTYIFSGKSLFESIFFIKWLLIGKSGVMLVSFFLCWLIKDAQVKQLDEDFSYFSLAQKTIRFVKEDQRQLLLIPITLFGGDSRFYWLIKNLNWSTLSIHRNFWFIDFSDWPNLKETPPLISLEPLRFRS